MRRFWSILALLVVVVSLALPFSIHAATYADTVLADSPDSYYRLGETEGTTAADSSGNNNDGTYHNVTLGIVGAPYFDSDKAASFNGSDAYISVPSLALTGSFAVEAWIKPLIVGDPPGFSVPIMIFEGWGDDEYFVLEISDDGHYKAEYRNTGSIISGPFQMDYWHHIVYSYDSIGDTGTLYVDGMSQGSSANGPMLVTTPTIEIGDFQSTYWYYGKLDEVAFYSHVLSSERVQAHYVAAGRSLVLTATPSPTATETLTPTPPPWVLATLASGQTWQHDYITSDGDILIFIPELILVGLAVLGLILQLRRR